MELAQTYLMDAAWIFFTAWGMVLLAVGAVAFGQDLHLFSRHDQTQQR